MKNDLEDKKSSYFPLNVIFPPMGVICWVDQEQRCLDEKNFCGVYGIPLSWIGVDFFFFLSLLWGLKFWCKLHHQLILHIMYYWVWVFLSLYLRRYSVYGRQLKLKFTGGNSKTHSGSDAPSGGDLQLA